MKFRFSERKLRPSQWFTGLVSNLANTITSISWSKQHFQSLISSRILPLPHQEVESISLSWMWAFVTPRDTSVEKVLQRSGAQVWERYSICLTLSFGIVAVGTSRHVGEVPAPGRGCAQVSQLTACIDCQTWTNEPSASPAPPCVRQHRHTLLAELCPNSWATKSLGVMHGCSPH